MNNYIGAEGQTYEEFGEEDRALLVAPQQTYHSDDEGNIDDGEYWGEVEDAIIESDLPIPSVESTDSTPESQEADRTQHKAFNLVTLLSVMLAKWSYKYNITQNAFNSLLKLIGLFFSALSNLYPLLQPVFSLFPVSLHLFKKVLHINENNFVQYVVCPSCHSLYDYKNCFDHLKKPKTCSYVRFPEHRMLAHRSPCQSRLLAEITLRSGCHKFYPLKFYCFRSISDSLVKLVGR